MSFFRRRRSKNVGAQEYDNQAADASPETSRGVTVHGARSITMPPFASSDDLRVAADNYAHVHQELERIVRSELVPSDRSAAVDILAAIGVAQPNIVLTSRELFQGMVSVMSLGPSEVEAWIADLEANTNTGTALVVNIKHRNVPTVLVAFRDLEGRYINYYCHPDVIRDWPLSGQQEQPPRSVEVGAAPATFTRAQASNPEEALSILFEQAVPAAGIADKTRVEEQYLPWHKNMGAEPENTYRGSADAIKEVLLHDLRHMEKERGFEYFKIEVVPQQNAADVMSLMNEQSRAGYTVGVPMRVWPCGDNHYVAVGLHSSWR